MIDLLDVAAPSQGHRRWGAILAGTAVEFRVWAPKAASLKLVLVHETGDEVLPMLGSPEAGFSLSLPDVRAGQRYLYEFPSGKRFPDPCSLSQPLGVSGPSEVVLPSEFTWTDQAWPGVAWRDLVFYELHVGTMTPDGTFDAVIPHLKELRELGITAVEIMPVNQFPGSRNWGYDGVFAYAAQNTYGGPQGLQRLVDACHRENLAVFLDVVYNHFGPEGNVLREYGPYFNDCYRTPWGDAVNFDGENSEPVRDFVLDNARMWLEEFHFDGLRLDAVHAIYDRGARPILRSLGDVAADVSQRTGRRRYVVAESDLNDPRLLQPREVQGCELDAQWADDFHHAVHTQLTGERQGYYADYGQAPQLAEVFRTPYLFQGNYSACRKRKHGASPEGLPPEQFVVFIQNHDQVGNRAEGDRLSQRLSPAQQRLAASLLLLSPYTPMLFMGEEYGETRPFPFFCSFVDPALVDAVRTGRKREFAHFEGLHVPDPQSEETFASARLTWDWPEGTLHHGLRNLYRDLLSLRRDLRPLLANGVQQASLTPDPASGPLLQWSYGEGDTPRLQLFANLSPQTQPLPASDPISFASENACYHGTRSNQMAILLPWECVVIHK